MKKYLPLYSLYAEHKKKMKTWGTYYTKLKENKRKEKK